MKKVLLVVGAIALLAAGCSSNATTNVDSATESLHTKKAPISNANTQSVIAEQKNIKIKSADDIAKLIDKDTASEQTATAADDDSDLSAMDKAALDDFGGISNE